MTRTHFASPPLSVLVVDDDPDTTAACAELLRLSGFDAREAYSGREALDAAADDPPDVALIDLMMPGVDGFALARRLRAGFPDRRPLLVAVTGCTGDDCRRWAVEAGFDLHVAKPVEPAVLVGVLRRFERVLRGAVVLNPTTA